VALSGRAPSTIVGAIGLAALFVSAVQVRMEVATARFFYLDMAIDRLVADLERTLVSQSTSDLSGLHRFHREVVLAPCCTESANPRSSTGRDSIRTSRV
jgi:hypothetical protein